MDEMWNRYEVTLTVAGPFAAAIPKTSKEIQAMLEHRAPARKPEGAVGLAELAEQVTEEVGADQEEAVPGWATFKRNGDGLYYEGRCIRGHLKDCAAQVQVFFPETKNFRSKLVNRVYVETDVIPLGLKEPTGTEQRFVQVMTRQGPRSSIKYIDYVESPTLKFVLRVLNDKVTTLEVLDAVFQYGATHGLGQERSQGWGRYSHSIKAL